MVTGDKVTGKGIVIGSFRSAACFVPMLMHKIRCFVFYISETIWFQRLNIELTANIKIDEFNLSAISFVCLRAMYADAFGSTCQNRLYKTLNRF